MQQRVFRLASAISIFVSIAASATDASATVSPTVLSDGDFIKFTEVQDRFFTVGSGSGSGFLFDVCPSCGTGGSGTAIVTDFGFIGPGTGFSGITDTSLTYNLSALGPISSINVSFDKNLTISGSGFPLGTFNNTTFAPLILQGTRFYLAFLTSGTHIFNVPGSSGYNQLTASGLTASDFIEINPITGQTISSSHPDFSSNGALLVFGLFSLAIVPDTCLAPCTVHIAAFWDNLSFTVTSTQLPAALPLFAGGLGVIGLLARRRKQRHAAALP